MSGSRKPLRVCIVGAGATGLCSAHHMLNEGFEPVIFERADTLGGLWAYRDDSIEGRASVMQSTVINSSKEMTAFR